MVNTTRNYSSSSNQRTAWEINFSLLFIQAYPELALVALGEEVGVQVRLFANCVPCTLLLLETQQGVLLHRSSVVLFVFITITFFMLKLSKKIYIRVESNLYNCKLFSWSRKISSWGTWITRNFLGEKELMSKNCHRNRHIAIALHRETGFVVFLHPSTRKTERNLRGRVRFIDLVRRFSHRDVVVVDTDF